MERKVLFEILPNKYFYACLQYISITQGNDPEVLLPCEDTS